MFCHAEPACDRQALVKHLIFKCLDSSLTLRMTRNYAFETASSFLAYQSRRISVRLPARHQSAHDRLSIPQKHFQVPFSVLSLANPVWTKGDP